MSDGLIDIDAIQNAAIIAGLEATIETVKAAGGDTTELLKRLAEIKNPAPPAAPVEACTSCNPPTHCGNCGNPIIFVDGRPQPPVGIINYLGEHVGPVAPSEPTDGGDA